MQASISLLNSNITEPRQSAYSSAHLSTFGGGFGHADALDSTSTLNESQSTQQSQFSQTCVYASMRCDRLPDCSLSSALLRPEASPDEYACHQVSEGAFQNGTLPFTHPASANRQSNLPTDYSIITRHDNHSASYVWLHDNVCKDCRAVDI
ncbi:unnamed protein product [Protopolystoma xenopodis]|uniref:Uncharacterized protein n=1 Tax=Protopolystoma xenopodis TaxID=117903 RepID=A0A448WJH5_9PLAT|nr:unnamed protein product [Protopolystoma xenopodis]